jgi:glycosyltransferase involved in cell wall biosynthesis
LASKGNGGLKIIFLADVSISRIIGGAERVLFEQSTRLAGKGHNVHILTRRLPSHKKNREIICNVNEWRYDSGQQNNALLFLKTTSRNARLLFEFIHRRYGFDCINAHQPFTAFGVNQSLISKGIRNIYSCHSLSHEEYISRNIKPNDLIKRILYLLHIFARKWIEKNVLKHSHTIIVLSRFTQEKLKTVHKIHPQKVSVIPGGVDLKRFSPSDNKRQIRVRLNIPDKKIVLFTVRNLVQRMGLENLISTVGEVVHEIPDIYLVMGGEGPLKDHLMDQVERLGLPGFIKFAGFISEADLPDYYRMSDFFVLPTRELEGFGLITLEALASGIPVLGTPVGGTKEILGGFDSGLLFRDTGVNSMAELIISKCRMLKNDPDHFRTLSFRCRAFVEKRYSWERNIDALEKVFVSPSMVRGVVSF